MESTERSDDTLESEFHPDDWNTEPEQQEADLLLIGDSIIRHIHVDRLNANGTVNEMICLPGKKTEDIKLSLKNAVRKSNYKNVIIHCSSNNIPDEPPIKVANDLIMLARTVRENMPTTNCFVSAVLPKICPGYLPGINEINQLVCDASSKYGFKFIQHPQFSSGGILNTLLYAKRELVNSRPIHLSFKGVAQLAQNCRAHIKQMYIQSIVGTDH